MSRVIPKEQLAAYQRWQLGSFGEAEKPATPAQEPATLTEPANDSDHGTLADFAPVLPTADQIEAIHEQARNEGFQAGYEEGRQAALAECEQLKLQELAKVAGFLEHFQQSLKALDQVVADQALDLALEVASRVVGSTVNARPELLIPVIREALQALPIHHGSFGIHVHPSEIELLREHVAELAAQTNFQLIPDSSLSPGGCLIKAGHSEIDATLETRWKKVLDAIGVDSDQWQIS